MFLIRLLTNIKKSVGPRTDPWETPPGMSVRAVEYPPNITLNVLPLRKLFAQVLSLPVIPSDFTFE